MKKPWLSKTLILNLVGAGLALVCTSCNEWFVGHASEMILLLTGLNFVLRLVTKEKISLH